MRCGFRRRTGIRRFIRAILAPVYRIFGIDLRAFKIATVLCFIGFLAVYAESVQSEIGWAGTAVLLALLSFNPVFWGQRDFILSEFPYLLFSFAALLAIERVYDRLSRDRFELGSALLVSVLVYCAYGTRTIGIALAFALVAADLAKFRRPSRFLFSVLGFTGVLVAVQTLLLTSPKGYVSAFHFSLHTVAVNIVYYGKTLSYVWQNGWSKEIQIVFAMAVYGGGDLGFSEESVARTRRKGILSTGVCRRFADLELRDRPAWLAADSATVFLLWTEGMDSDSWRIEVTCSSHSDCCARWNRCGELRWRN